MLEPWSEVNAYLMSEADRKRQTETLQNSMKDVKLFARCACGLQYWANPGVIVPYLAAHQVIAYYSEANHTQPSCL